VRPGSHSHSALFEYVGKELETTSRPKYPKKLYHGIRRVRIEDRTDPKLTAYIVNSITHPVTPEFQPGSESLLIKKGSELNALKREDAFYPSLLMGRIGLSTRGRGKRIGEVVLKLLRAQKRVTLAFASPITLEVSVQNLHKRQILAYSLE